MARRKPRSRESRALQRKDEALGRKVLARQKREAAVTSQLTDGRVQGFLAGLGATALLWLLTARSSS